MTEAETYGYPVMLYDRWLAQRLLQQIPWQHTKYIHIYSGKTNWEDSFIQSDTINENADIILERSIRDTEIYVVIKVGNKQREDLYVNCRGYK